MATNFEGEFSDKEALHQERVRMYVIGAVKTLHEAANSLEKHPEFDAVTYLRNLADSICFRRPDVIEHLERAE